jgi:hypothetical protein
MTNTKVSMDAGVMPSLEEKTIPVPMAPSAPR